MSVSRRERRPVGAREWAHLQRGLAAATRRLRRGASQQKAAQAAGISIGVVKNVEGKNSAPTLKSLHALAHSFGLRTSELVEQAEEFDRAQPLSGRDTMFDVVTAPDSAPNLAAFGRAVRYQRGLLKLSQAALGERSGLHRNYIGVIERGQVYAGFRVLVSLSRGLELLPSELLRLSEDEHVADVELRRATAARARRAR